MTADAVTAGNGCCAPGRATRASSVHSTRSPVPPSLRADSAPDRTVFNGGRSFVGTDAAVIAEDGEGPRRRVTLKPFAMETRAVTNASFARFVAETGHVTTSEAFGWSHVFRGLLPPHARVKARDTGLPWWLEV